jgi:hypothetical protein
MVFVNVWKLLMAARYSQAAVLKGVISSLFLMSMAIRNDLPYVSFEK